MCLVGSLTAVSATVARYPLYGGQAVRYAVAALILLAVARLRGGIRRGAGLVGVADDRCARGHRASSGSTSASSRARTTRARATIGTVIGTVPIVLAVVAPLMDRRARRRASWSPR